MLKSLAAAILVVFHPVHVTMTSVDYISGTDSLKVFIRMYYDDFLLDFSSSGITAAGEKYNAGNTIPGDLMNNYVDEKVNIIVNNKHLKGKLLNLNLTNNEISMDLVYLTDKRPRTITVRNTIMTGLYSDQANMVIIRVDDLEEGVKLTPVKTEQTYSVKRRRK